MTDDDESKVIYERLRKQIEALQAAPPLEKARTFLKDFAAATDGLPEIEEQVQYSLGFNSIPVWTGLEGLEAILRDITLNPEQLIALVRHDANQLQVPPTPETAREFLASVVEILRRQLGVNDEPEGSFTFETGYIFTLPNTEGRVERLRCVDLFLIGDETFALLVPEGAEGPYTVYKYEMFPEARMTYELVTDEAARKKVLDAADPGWDARTPGR